MNQQAITSKPFRLDWLDLARVVGIYLVICGHGPLLNSAGDQFVYSFHMPLFFLISGILAKPRNFKDTIVKSFKTLLIPYFLLNAVCMLYSICMHLFVGTYHFSQTLSNLGAIFLGLGYSYNGLEPVSTPTWFLVSLFFIKLLSQPCKTVLHHIVLSISSIIICLILKHYNFDTVIPIDSALLALPFYCMGVVCQDLFKKQNVKWKSVVIAITSLAGLILVNHFNGRVDINMMEYGNSPLLYLLGGILGSVCVIECCKVMGGGICISQLSRGTVLILAFNIIAVNWVVFIFQKICSLEMNNVIGMLMALLILVLFYPLIRFVQKYCPILLGNR